MPSQTSALQIFSRSRVCVQLTASPSFDQRILQVQSQVDHKSKVTTLNLMDQHQARRANFSAMSLLLSFHYSSTHVFMVSSDV